MMATSINELTAYYQFINDNYPHSAWKNRIKNFKNSFLIFFDDLKILDLFIDYDYVHVFNRNSYVRCVSDLRNAFLHLLLVLPLNDSYFISTAFRLISECELKLFLISINADPTVVRDIRTIKFRYLWEEGIKKSEQYKNVTFKKCLDEVSQSFRKNSDIIHAKKIPSQNLVYLEKILSTNVNEIRTRDLQRELRIINQFTLNILPEVLNISSAKMTMGQKGILKEMTSSPEF